MKNKLIDGSDRVGIVLIGYCVSALALSISIFARFFLPPSFIVQWSNVVLYLAIFQAIPWCLVFVMFVEAWDRKMWLKWIAAYCFFLWTLFSALAFIFSVPLYLFFWIPLLPAFALREKWKGQGTKLFRKRNLIVVASVFVLLSILPFLVAFAGENQVLSRAASLSTTSEKACFINSRVGELTAYGSINRAFSDYWKFLLSGSGECREMATASVNLMQQAGIESRIVVIPGEHAFVEVNVDGEWLIPSGSAIINRTVFAEERMRDPGSLSYIIAEIGDSFVELTPQYVSTDTITIRVTRNSEPVAETRISLVRFGTLSAQIPEEGHYFHTDSNGTVTLHLGKPHFVGQYQNTDEFYWVYVNGEKTNYKVTSTGTGSSYFVEIELK